MNKYYKGEPKLLVSVDCIVLGFENKKLQLLVGKRKVEPYSGKLSLYGGFVREDESLKEAANRVLFQCTGINDIYMRQVGAFGETERFAFSKTKQFASLKSFPLRLVYH